MKPSFGSTGGGQSVRGYTVAELLLGASLFGLLVGSVSLAYTTIQGTYAKSSSFADLQQNAKIALELMTYEIRQAGNFTGEPPNSSAVWIATNDTLSIHGDVDGTGNRHVTYSLRDAAGGRTTTLLRQSSLDTAAGRLFSGGELVIDHVADLRFTYYDGQDQPLVDPIPNPPVYQLDGQAHVTGGNAPSIPTADSQRELVRRIRIDLTLADRSNRFTVVTDVRLRNLQ
jgi:hypothetical protein